MDFNFNLANTPPSTGAEVTFPLGDYPVEITKEEVKAVKDKQNGGYVAFTLTVIDGPMKGQTKKYRLNLWSDNEQAVGIAQGELSAMALVSGRSAATATQHLIGARFIATIGPQDDNPKYSEVKLVKDVHGRTVQEIISGNPVPIAQPQQQAAPATPAAAWGPQPGQLPMNPGGMPGAPQGQPAFAQPSQQPAFAQPPQQAMPFGAPAQPAFSQPASGFGAPAQPASPFGAAQPQQNIPAWATAGK